MKAGRKNLQRACQDGSAVTLAEGESIMQVVTLRGSNLIEVHALFSRPPSLLKSRFVPPADLSLARALLLGHGRRGRQVPGLVPGQVPEELLDQER
jgi:hypothetical protein